MKCYSRQRMPIRNKITSINILERLNFQPLLANKLKAI
jgi:hypothetical protein